MAPPFSMRSHISDLTRPRGPSEPPGGIGSLRPALIRMWATRSGCRSPAAVANGIVCVSAGPRSPTSGSARGKLGQRHAQLSTLSGFYGAQQQIDRGGGWARAPERPGPFVCQPQVPSGL